MMQASFPEIAQALEQAGSTVPAAESHGCLCGAACVRADMTLERWLEEILPASDEESPVRERCLELLFADTIKALREDQMAFEPLLPDDDVALAQRAQALASWCQGFLYGFGTGGLAASGLPDVVNEVLRDFSRIARTAADPGEASEEEEQAYAEVVEYLRAGVQLVHDELIGARAGEAARGDADTPDRPDED
ncbi:MAG: UPF0149 family protein [Pseudomonadota bacterium]